MAPTTLPPGRDNEQHKERDRQLLEAANRLGGPVFTGIAIFSGLIIIVATIIHAGFLFSLPASLEEAKKEDLAAFWRAGRMALDGAAALAYDPEAFQAALPPPNHTLYWLNPPHFFLLVTPLSLLPYGAAKALMLGLTFAAIIAVARLAARGPLSYALIITAPATYVSALLLQLGPFVVLGLTFAMTAARTRPLMSGLVLAFLTMKPQYGVLIPIFLAALGCWRAIAAAAGFTALLVAASALVFGVETWAAYVSIATGDVYRDYLGVLSQATISLSQSVAKLGGDTPLRMTAQLCGMALAAVAVWRAARRWPQDAAIGFTLLAAAFSAPSVWLYDWLLVCAGLFMLARAASPWPLSLQVAAGLAWASLIAPLIDISIPPSLAPPAMLALALIAAWVWGERLSRAARPGPQTGAPA